MSCYNGWHNKETWLVNVWLGDYFIGLQEQGDIVINANFIEREIDQHLENLSLDAGLLSDLINCAVGEIDYHEIASHFGNE
ncbi:MAG: hypothetical protein P8M25_17865 [Paracoccaceae bacterium]|nr:hypothetical protein [Paracoccaceae bacterium]